MTQPQSETERRVLTAIKALIKENGYSPSVRELCAYPGMGMSSSSTMQWYLDLLEDHGFITRVPGITRSIRIVSQRKKAA